MTNEESYLVKRGDEVLIRARVIDVWPGEMEVIVEAKNLTTTFFASTEKVSRCPDNH